MKSFTLISLVACAFSTVLAATSSLQPISCASHVTLSGNAFASYNLWTNTIWAAEVDNAATQISDSTLAENARQIGAAGAFYWIDTIAQVPTMDALIKAVPCDSIIGFVIYDLPGRDCASGASGGELEPGQLDIYKSEFIDSIRTVILGNPNTAIVLLIEPDSLPNLVTNIDLDLCAAAAQGYQDGIAYALAQFNLPNVVMYIDAGNSGWLGWDANLEPGAEVIANVWKAAGSPGQVHGFATNVANYNAWSQIPGEFSGDSDAQYNPAQDEKRYVDLMGAALAANGMPNHAIVDTSRNGVTGLRLLQGDWCNVKGAGFGALPTSFTGDDLADAFVWVKLGGESDGVSDPTADRYSSVCGGADAFQPSPQAGQWNQPYFEELVANAVAIPDYLPAVAVVETFTEPDGTIITLTLPPGEPFITGVEVITTDGSTITIGPVGIVETLTEPDGARITLTLPPGSPSITGVETITTGGSTITVGPVPALRSTMTTLPAGVSLEDFTDFPVASNVWLTTTGSDSSTTIVPVILPCPTCQPVIVWDTPEIPDVQFSWPSLPELPSFHLPCVKVFGIVVAGTCPTASGPPPVNDDNPPDPKASTAPDPDDPDDGEDDPCEMDTSVGMCSNGNYPVFDTTSGTMSCEFPSDQAGANMGACQQAVDDNFEAVQDYLENERSCCPASSKAKRQASGRTLPSLLRRGLGSLGLMSLDKRADYCPNLNENPKEPPADRKCYATYTCPHALFPNVCGNAKSAIQIRGATSILTHVSPNRLHDTKPWYEGHFRVVGSAPKVGGWKLDVCQVEEYPFGSGNPDRSNSGQSVLRLIPGGKFGQGWENQLAGSHLARWIKSIATQYNRYQKALTGKNPKLTTSGIVYCVDFDASFTNYLPEDLVDRNICAQRFGPEFTLVNDHLVADADGEKVRTWDPWFDVPGTNRKSLELMYYLDSSGLISLEPTADGESVSALLPPTYCQYPSPGSQTYNKASGTWSLVTGFTSAGRMDNIVTKERCTNPPGTPAKRGEEQTAAGGGGAASANQTRAHPRDLNSRQSSPGGFLDPNVYKWMGCSDIDDSDGEGDDPCDDDDSGSCGNVLSLLPTTNGANPTQDPLPAASEGGATTRAVTTKTAASPTITTAPSRTGACISGAITYTSMASGDRTWADTAVAYGSEVCSGTGSCSCTDWTDNSCKTGYSFAVDIQNGDLSFPPIVQYTYLDDEGKSAGMTFSTSSPDEVGPCKNNNAGGTGTWVDNGGTDCIYTYRFEFDSC